jgi:hypothetical protein
MAKTLDTFPDYQSSQAKYPWSDWTDGQVWQIVQGEDFTLSPKSMRMTIAARASTLGLRVRTTVQGNTVTFQFRAKDDGEVAA